MYFATNEDFPDDNTVCMHFIKTDLEKLNWRTPEIIETCQQISGDQSAAPQQHPNVCADNWGPNLSFCKLHLYRL